MHVMPVFHRKLLKMDLGGVNANLTRLHFAIMGVLSEGSLPASELARALMITKPQMTHLVDQLVKMGIVERQPDNRDRRVINLALTGNGSKLRDEMKQKIDANIKSKLTCLTQDELQKMANALETLKIIGARLN